MKEVIIELKNIQSHELTRFTLKPGINFIISPDNNVGKSTIFGVLNALIEVSCIGTNRVNLNNLLRVNTNDGYAMFMFDDVVVIFWLLRKDNSDVTFIFQTTINGESVQSASPPNLLLDALDIHGNLLTNSVHNILEADKVQLIVDEGKQCDEIIQSVLIDESVEKAKEHISLLYSKAMQDKKLNEYRIEDLSYNLSTLTYNNTVDSFYTDLPLLEALDYVLDSPLPNNIKSFNIPNISLLKLSSTVLNNLTSINWSTLSNNNTHSDIDLELPNVSLDTLNLLKAIKLTPKLSITKEYLNFLNIVNDTVSMLRYILTNLNNIRLIENELGRTEYTYKSLLEDIISNNKIVMCPEKGRVIYCGKECIPISDRPTL